MGDTTDELHSLTGLRLKDFFSHRPVVRLGQVATDTFTLSVMAAADFSMRIPAGDRGEHLVFPISGSVQMSQGDFNVVLTGGSNELYFVRGHQPLDSSLSMRGAVLVFVSFPQGIARVLSEWGLPGYRVPEREVTRSLINNAAGRFFLELVQTHREAELSHLGPLEGAVQDLFAALLRANLEIPASLAHRSTKSLAMEQVLAHGLKADFTVGAIAERMHISSRQLQRAFADGEPLSAILLKHRVFNARKILIAPEHSGLTYLEVARRSGFSDTRALRRATQAVLGKLPPEIRNETPAQASGL